MPNYQQNQTCQDLLIASSTQAKRIRLLLLTPRIRADFLDGQRAGLPTRYLCQADLATIADVSLPASAQILVLQFDQTPVPTREGLIKSLSVIPAETTNPVQDGEHAGEDCYRPFGSPFCLIGLSSSIPFTVEPANLPQLCGLLLAKHSRFGRQLLYSSPRALHLHHAM